MHDEFRLEVRLDDPRALLRALSELPPDESPGNGGGSPGAGAEGGAEPQERVVVTHEDRRVMLYADHRDVAEHAVRIVATAMERAGLHGETQLRRWHPVEERWEDAALPLPASDAERAAERARLDEQERAESRAAGYPEWEVRITLPSLHEARSFAGRLEAEGVPVVRRWRHLLVGADNEDQAAALAERLRAEAPDGSDIETMGAGGPAAWGLVAGPARRFAVFGGLGW
jgi:hypothetical protein